MDLTREYNNPNLERKRQKLLRDQDVLRTLKAAKPRQGGIREAVVNGLGNDHNASKSALAREIGAKSLSLSASSRSVFRDLLLTVEKESSLLEDTKRFLTPLTHLASWSLYWVRNPADWKAKSYNAERCFSSLARHLLARYDVPVFMDHAWLSSESQAREYTPQTGKWQEWFIHIGQGQNIRKVDNFPVAFTKMQAHHFLLAPKDYTIPEAIRWGQVRGMGGEERLVEAVIGTHLGRRFHKDEPFWATVLQWFVANQTMDVRQVGPIIDYIENQRHVDRPSIWMNGGWRYQGPEQPNFAMKGRTADSLIRQVETWHKALARIKTRKVTSWETCGIKGFDRIEGDGTNSRHFIIRELLTSSELATEGRAMNHCVGSYSHSCSSRRCAIYSMQVNPGSGALERRLTIEVDLHSRTIVQARRKCNLMPTDVDSRILRAWATAEGLSMGRWVRL
jgi:hypothetical protein